MMFAFSNCSKSKAGAFVIAAATLRLVGILLLQSSAAMANVGSAAPPGSYQQSCTSISYSANGVLTASCDKSEPEGYCGQPFCPGVSSPAQIYVPACQPGVDIANINGHLQCIAKTGTWGDGRAIPPGSYLNSCLNFYVYKNRLSANCPTAPGNGDYQATLLDLTQCQMGGDIQNHGGQLLCVPKSPNTPPPPPPPSQQQIAQQAKQQSALKQLEGMGCTQQIITETCPTENSYLLCREYVANHSLSAGFGCKGPGLIEKEYASADKALMSMGCSHLLGRVSDYICPDSSSYNLCKTYRGNGVVTNCRLK